MSRRAPLLTLFSLTLYWLFSVTPLSERYALAAPTTEASSTSDTTGSCLASYDEYQKLLDRGRLVEAKRALGGCGSATCPATLQRECAAAFVPLESRIPTVIIVARDANKHDLPSVSVLLDGQPYKSVDGREGEIDPGPHTFRFVTASGQSVEQRVIINEREKGRFIEVTLPVALLPPSPSQTTSATSEGVPPPAIVFAVVGGLALGTSAYFGVSGFSARSDVTACKGSCTQDQVDAVNHRFLAADISLGVSVVALAAAAWLYFTRPTANTQVTAAR